MDDVGNGYPDSHPLGGGTPQVSDIAEIEEHHRRGGLLDEEDIDALLEENKQLKAEVDSWQRAASARTKRILYLRDALQEAMIWMEANDSLVVNLKIWKHLTAAINKE